MKNKTRGAVLLVTLWILAILSLLAVGIGFRTSIELKLTSYQVDSLKAYEIAKAGVIKAINELERDKSPNTDTLWECGISVGQDETLEAKFKDIKIGDGHFKISYTDETGNEILGIQDLQGKINVNSANRDILKALSAGFTDYTIPDNIRAWRGDADALNKNYSDKPYPCKGAPLDIIEELLLVKDMTQEIYDAIKGPVTVYPTDPKEKFALNVNTASQKALEALGLGESAAKIVIYRAGEDGDINTPADNKVFNNIDEVRYFLKSAIGGSFDDTALENLRLENLLCYGSNYFMIRSVGALEGKKARFRKVINCVVRRAAGADCKTEVIGWFEE